MTQIPREIDQRDLYQYGYTEASKATRIPVSTLRAWTRGQEGFNPVFKPASEQGLSYFNLIEAQVLRAIRKIHKISMPNVRKALDIAEGEYGKTRLFIDREFRFGAFGLFIEQYSKLISLTQSSQETLYNLLKDYLDRVEYDKQGFPKMFFPSLETEPDERLILINPFVSFGRATVVTRSISTDAIVARIEAGEEKEFVSQDYGIPEEEIEAAIEYETPQFNLVY